MGSPYVGEIRMFAGNFPPNGWMFCDGQLLPISQYETLFNLIGTTYGGDGQSTFALPDLLGRLPVHMGTSTTGTNYIIGQKAGVETVTLNVNQIPLHTHPLLGSNNGASGTAPGNMLAGTTAASTITAYGTDAPPVALAANSVSSVGGSQPHDNFQPYACINFIISLFGVFPSPN
ncbi:MAG TPA: tail fiber protein [Planctomycetota bacterium]|nr:tail fiber protein [Planctomycetota bacterium]